MSLFKTTVQIEQDIKPRLVAEAKKNKRSISNMIGIMIDYYFEHKYPQEREKEPSNG